MISINASNNADAVLSRLLHALDLDFKRTEIAEELQRHPEYPSLLSISEVLTNFNIAHEAYRIPHEELRDVPGPFIAHTDMNGGDLLVVEEIKGNHVFVSNNFWKRHKMGIDSFTDHFSGVILTAYPEPEQRMSVSAKILRPFNRFVTYFMVTVLTLLAIVKTGFLATFAATPVILAALKSGGLAVSALLLLQSINSNSPLIQKVCKKGTKFDCNEILSSNAARVTSWLSWSDVGFLYFSFTFLLTVLTGHQPATLFLLLVLNVFSLPYTFYSLYYQKYIAKKWCVLCCSILAILWLEFVLLAVNATVHGFAFALPMDLVTTALICLLSLIVAWSILKPLLVRLQDIQPLKDSLRAVKFNHQVFSGLLAAQPAVELPAEEWAVVFGNPDAAHVITMVTNPACAPCAAEHQRLEDLLEKRADIQARLVFMVTTEDLIANTPVCRHMLAISKQGDNERTTMALHDWYTNGTKDYEKWAAKYPVSYLADDMILLPKHSEWCNRWGINRTPTLFLNANRLPETYRLMDLKYLL